INLFFCLYVMATCLDYPHIRQVHHHSALVKMHSNGADKVYDDGDMTSTLVTKVSVQPSVAYNSTPVILRPGDFRVRVRFQLGLSEVHNVDVAHPIYVKDVLSRPVWKLVRLPGLENPVSVVHEKA